MSDVEELEQENANLRARLCTMENRVAYLEATPKPDSPAGYGETCDSCGRSYEITYRVPDDIWLKIAPKPEAMGAHPEHALGGLLCPDCASSRAKALGVTLRFNADTDWPDSPVCVEVRELIWVNRRIDATFAETPFGVKYSVRESVTHPGSYRAYFAGEMLIDYVASPELAKMLCQADFARRTQELVNARSVESVKAELLAEMLAEAKAEYAAACKAMDGARMVHASAHYSALRSLTEGEG